MDNCTILRKAAGIIKSGGVVIFPTETVYGIGANGLDEKAIKKLFDIKQRPLNKPISLLVSDFDMISKVAQNITNLEQRIIEAFFPGPLTIVLEKKEIVPNILTNNTNTVGIRMPEGEIARKLVGSAGVPIATTSANISGDQSGTNLGNIRPKFEDKVDYLIDGGESKIGVPSTVIRVVDDEIQVLREGSITKEQIMKKLKI